MLPCHVAMHTRKGELIERLLVGFMCWDVTRVGWVSYVDTNVRACARTGSLDYGNLPDMDGGVARPERR